jgi:hypothetical protein
MIDIRFFQGRQAITIIKKFGNKVFIKHLENGITGSKDIGYKLNKKGDFNITLLRFCYKNQFLPPLSKLFK